MNMAKADTQEVERLARWFQQCEANGTRVPEWRRVVFGYQTLVDSACDPSANVLAWNEELNRSSLAEQDLREVEKERNRLREALLEVVLRSDVFAEEWVWDLDDSSIEERFFNNGEFRLLREACDAAKLLLEETAS